MSRPHFASKSPLLDSQTALVVLLVFQDYLCPPCMPSCSLPLADNHHVGGRKEREQKSSVHATWSVSRHRVFWSFLDGRITRKDALELWPSTLVVDGLDAEKADASMRSEETCLLVEAPVVRPRLNSHR